MYHNSFTSNYLPNNTLFLIVVLEIRTASQELQDTGQQTQYYMDRHRIFVLDISMDIVAHIL